MKFSKLLPVLLFVIRLSAMAQEVSPTPKSNLQVAVKRALKRASEQIDYVVSERIESNINNKTRVDTFEVTLYKGEESYRKVKKDGKLGRPKTASKTKAKAGSSDEWFSDLLMVIKPEADAKIDFVGRQVLGNRPVDVYHFKVEKEYSELGISYYGFLPKKRKDVVPFEGELLVGSDNEIYQLRFRALEIPKKNVFISAEKTVNYDYVRFAGMDEEYFVPTGAEVRAHIRGAIYLINTISFRNYRVFGTGLKIKLERTIPEEIEALNFKITIPSL